MKCWKASSVNTASLSGTVVFSMKDEWRVQKIQLENDQHSATKNQCCLTGLCLLGLAENFFLLVLLVSNVVSMDLRRILQVIH